MSNTLRLVTYNIHKGVRGLGPNRRLEIHNLQTAIAQLDADVVCLQEVRAHHRRLQHHFLHWPRQAQAQFLAPPGYHAVYQSHAFTRHGEHGNAVLSPWPVLGQRAHDMSAHRFEQRGLLHVRLQVRGQVLHVIVVHLALTVAARARQIERLGRYLERAVPKREATIVAGDFNDWGARLRPAMQALGFTDYAPGRALRTYPARWPLVQLDYAYAKGLRAQSAQVLHGPSWWRMSDHLPLVAEFEFGKRR